MRLIDADALKRRTQRVATQAAWKMNIHARVETVLNQFIDFIDDAPTVDAVPVKSIEQLKWERDEAIQELEEHGIPFCGKADVVAVVRCKECKHRPKYDGPNRLVFPDGICPCQCDDEYYNWMPSDDWFCADGERKDDADT